MKQAEQRYNEIKEAAQAAGYMLNRDAAFCIQLAEGLLKNAERYGVEACPCRLVRRSEDNTDIVCPCAYRDDDLAEYGTCFCALYVTEAYDNTRQIPDRRPTDPEKRVHASGATELRKGARLAYPVWRCTVCGYLCAHNHPPNKCPICKAGKDRFEQFM